MISINCDKQGVTVVSKNGHESAGQFARPSAILFSSKRDDLEEGVVQRLENLKSAYENT